MVSSERSEGSLPQGTVLLSARDVAAGGVPPTGIVERPADAPVVFAHPSEREFARIWNTLPKFVFSTTLESVVPPCRLVAGDVADRLAEIRSEFSGDLGVGGPTLASAFIKRGLVDEYRLVVHPVILGAGSPLFPALQDRIGLRLLETRTFESGVVSLRYETVR